MTVGNPNTEGYQIMADILVTVRRIVHRGLEKVAGETWYLDALPPGLFERLVERKEQEASIDRFNGEYQELISFASLDDLADVIEHNHQLSTLMAGIEPEGSTMAERLRELEALRLKLAATAPFDDDDLERLVEYHQELKRTLARRTKQAQEPEPPRPTATFGAPVAEADPKPDAAEHTAAAAANSAQDESVEIENGGSTEEVDEAVNPYSTEIAGVDELSKSDIVDADTYVTVATRLEVGAEDADDAPSDDLEAIEQATAADDDRAALEVLRREVMSVAESVLQNDPPQEYPVWESLGSSGWLNRKRDTLGLEPVEQFYKVAEGVLERRLAGHSADEVKAFIDDSKFSSLLLELREMFMKHQL